MSDTALLLALAFSLLAVVSVSQAGQAPPSPPAEWASDAPALPLDCSALPAPEPTHHVSCD